MLYPEAIVSPLRRATATRTSLTAPLNRGLVEDVEAGLARGRFAVATVEAVLGGAGSFVDTPRLEDNHRCPNHADSTDAQAAGGGPAPCSAHSRRNGPR